MLPLTSVFPLKKIPSINVWRSIGPLMVSMVTTMRWETSVLPCRWCPVDTFIVTMDAMKDPQEEQWMTSSTTLLPPHTVGCSVCSAVEEHSTTSAQGTITSQTEAKRQRSPSCNLKLSQFCAESPWTENGFE